MHKSRSIRRSGHPTVASAASRLRAFDRDPICEEHYGQRPAKSAASTGRTDGSTDQHCITVQKSLANREPSTDGYKQTFRGQLANVRFTPESGHSNHDSRSICTTLPPCPTHGAAKVTERPVDQMQKLAPGLGRRYRLRKWAALRRPVRNRCGWREAWRPRPLGAA